MPEIFQSIAPLINEGERWEKLPRFIPYFCLPLGFALLIYRFLQTGWRVWTGQQALIIASHEAEQSTDDTQPGSREVSQ